MYVAPENDRIRQGDIFKDVVFKNGYSSGEEIPFDFCLVLTQDCDLEQATNAVIKLEETKQQGYKQKADEKIPNNDKFLNNIIICPAFIADQLKEGIHLSNIEWKMERLGRDLWKPVTNNNSARYHYLPENIKLKLPALVVDFKHIYTPPIGYINSIMENKVAKLDVLFVESVSQRFAFYISRIALPDKKKD